MSNENQPRPLWELTSETTQQALTSYARRLVNGNVSEANDLVQETTYRALLHSNNLASVQNPLGYLLRMMRNIWIDAWKKKTRVAMESLDDLIIRRALKNEPAADPEVLRTLDNEDLEIAYHIRQGPLTDNEKKLLTLYLEGYNTREIAEILQADRKIVSVDLNAVRSKVRYRLNKARKTKASGKH